jgi:hypothetical protein
VPWSGDKQENRRAGHQVHFQQVSQVAGQQKKQKNDSAGKDNADEALGEDIQRDERGDAPAGEKTWLYGLPGIEEKIKRKADP